MQRAVRHEPLSERITYNLITKPNAPDEALPDILLPSPTIRTSRHLRDSSLGSSATVLIGLQVSNINDMPPVTSYYRAPYRGEPDYPKNFGLAISTDIGPVPPPPIDDTERADLGNEDKAFDGPADKQLPPVPLIIAKKDTMKEKKDKKEEDEIILSPSVYSPQEQSPKGSGKGKAAISPRGSPSRAPPPCPSWSRRVGRECSRWNGFGYCSLCCEGRVCLWLAL